MGDEPPAPGPKPRADRHDLRFDATAELYRLAGVDLTADPRLQAHTVLKVRSEIGLDLPRWPSAKPVGSWLGLAPNNRVSGGKILSRRTKPTATAYTLARSIFSLLSTGHAYCEPGQDAYERAHKDRAVRSRSKRASDLGYRLVKHDSPQPLTASA